MIRRFLCALLFTVPLVLTVAAGRGETPSDPLPDPGDRSAQLPFRGEIRTGRLNNGLEYFAVEHPHPENTVVLRLVVDAGSVLEEEDQAGLAHFVEHMAFNGTEEFGEDELVAYLESLGIQFGPDVNAYTSFDETVYKLELPSDDRHALETGFRVMAEWAARVSFDSAAIERERGVIVEEWRGGRGAGQRILEQHIPTLLADSRYEERLPIGDMAVVRNAPRERFVEFYRRWYRPDNMAFIVAGDIPTTESVRLIQRHLAQLQRPETALDRPYYTVPRSAETRVSIAGDPEASRSTVSSYVLRDPQPAETIEDYRGLLVRSLFAAVINERLREIARDPAAPITGAGLGYNRFLRDTEIAVGTAVVRDNRVLEAFEVLIRELERAERHGILPQELDRARRRLLQSIENSAVNFESRPSSSLADELVRHWLEGESVPGIAFERAMYETLVPGISAEEVSAVAHEFSDSRGRVILASLRTTADGALPNGETIPMEEAFRRVLTRLSETEIAPLRERATDRPLLSQAPAPGTVAQRIEHPQVETTELRLSNGMRVYVRPSDLAEDEVLFSAYSPGGLSLVDDALVTAARLAPEVARESGLGQLSASELERRTAGRSVSLSAGLNRVSESLSGSARRQDLSLLFEMIHAVFAEPRFDQQALENVRQQTLQRLEGSLASPQGQYARRFQELFSHGDPRLAALDPEAVAGVSLDQIQAVYRNRFANPDDFALFFVGTVTVEEVEALAEQYLAGLGGSILRDDEAETEFVETPGSVGFPRPDGTVSATVSAGQEPVGQFSMIVHGPYQWSRRENHRLNSLASLLDIRLREEIREDAGGAYSVGATSWRWRYPEPWSYVQLGFGLDPQRLDELRERTLRVIEELRTSLPDQQYVQRIKAQQRDGYQQQLQENEYWLSVLSFYVQHDRDLADILTYPELIDTLSPEELQRSAQRYLNPERRIELILEPRSEE